MTPSPTSIDRVVLPTDSTIPVARSAEYDTYFRISRSNDPHAWAVSALTVVTAITTDLPQSTLDNDSRLRLLDALAVVVGDASAAAAVSARERDPSQLAAPTDHSADNRTPQAPNDSARQAITRWKKGHHLFHLFVISMNSRLAAVLECLANKQWPTLAHQLTELGTLYAGATESMRYASDFSPEIYRDFVRPSMEPPWLEPGFSAVFNRDHDVMLTRAKIVRTTLKTAELPGVAADSARRLWKSQAENRRAHQLICQRFVPGGDSLLQEHFDSTGQSN
ncbi:hypothetical protein CH294_26030 [Rhodococcus sp. 14-2483-1-1]|uniref:Uncharacterized protein n=1 Tax=Rhodococcoides fascians D188 TaxID=1051973 RepID=G8JZ12_RHOFA|nr:MULTISPECIES: hypothetical protein [Rhodococcus]AET25283.1 hypothetical protein pFi_147 [Rhodococcus fascians D188]AMY56309.1 3-methyl-L-tyrosine peroxygenase [Rhodococcus fascians D188]OZC47844.1 hypothetical protein CH267_26405 [Rhodococcus sp. 06-621-2]OZC60692.1 hypothetical protein CH277_26935 [Rhodococcus sp. 06-469-3-2]OZC64157.1 hypothetical protein CH251_26055 [Rhodococcus sp. 06-462-5]